MTHTFLPAPTRMDAVQAPIIPIVGEWIRQTPGTISLGQGVVHYGPPPAALEALRASLTDPVLHGYHDGAGLPMLVEGVQRKLAAENDTVVGSGRQVLITAGANMAFMHAILTTTSPGDEVIVPVPFYFNHEMAIEMVGCRPVPVPTDDTYQLRLDLIRAALSPRTRAIVTVSPNNPTGAVLSDSSLRELNGLCRERGIYHISDETYEYFIYGNARHVSPASFADAEAHTIAIYSLSKAFGFAGWRIGYMVYPDHLAVAMMKSQDTILICPPIASQVAAAAALEVGRAYCEPYVRDLAVLRETVIARLSALAPLAVVPAAEGAFYCLMRIERAIDPVALAERLVREYRVAVIPGPAFGMHDGCYVRVAYGALQQATVAEGIGRLVDGLRHILA